MEAGRKFRNLGRLLEGVIFRYDSLEQLEACYSSKECTAPVEAMEYLRFLKKDRPVFLFEVDKRLLHGVLRTEGVAEHSKQDDLVKVAVSVAQRYGTLRECEFSPKIQLCYYGGKEFYYELTMEETLEVFRLFEDKKKADAENNSRHLNLKIDMDSSHAWGQPSSIRMKTDPFNSAGFTLGSSLPGNGLRRGEFGKDSAGFFGSIDSTASSTRQSSSHDASSSGRFAPLGLGQRGAFDDSLSGFSVNPQGIAEHPVVGESVLDGPIQVAEVDNNVLRPRQMMPPIDDLATSSTQLILPRPSVAFGREAASGTNAVVTQQMALSLGNHAVETIPGQPLQVVFQTHTEMGSPVNVRPTLGNGFANKETERLSQVVQQLQREVEMLKRDNTRTKEEEAMSRQRAQHDHAQLQAQLEIGRKTAQDLFDEKSEKLKAIKDLRAVQKDLEITIQELEGARDELWNAKKDLQFAQKSQNNLLKIQDDYLGSLEKRQRESQDLKAKVESLSGENLKLKAEIESLCTPGRGLPEPHGNDTSGITTRGVDSEGQLLGMMNTLMDKLKTFQPHQNIESVKRSPKPRLAGDRQAVEGPPGLSPTSKAPMKAPELPGSTPQLSSAATQLDHWEPRARYTSPLRSGRQDMVAGDQALFSSSQSHLAMAMDKDHHVSAHQEQQARPATAGASLSQAGAYPPGEGHLVANGKYAETGNRFHSQQMLEPSCGQSHEDPPGASMLAPLQLGGFPHNTSSSMDLEATQYIKGASKMENSAVPPPSQSPLLPSLGHTVQNSTRDGSSSQNSAPGGRAASLDSSSGGIIPPQVAGSKPGSQNQSSNAVDAHPSGVGLGLAHVGADKTGNRGGVPVPKPGSIPVPIPVPFAGPPRPSASTSAGNEAAKGQTMGSPAPHFSNDAEHHRISSSPDGSHPPSISTNAAAQRAHGPRGPPQDPPGLPSPSRMLQHPPGLLPPSHALESTSQAHGNPVQIREQSPVVSSGKGAGMGVSHVGEMRYSGNTPPGLVPPGISGRDSEGKMSYYSNAARKPQKLYIFGGSNEKDSDLEMGEVYNGEHQMCESIPGCSLPEDVGCIHLSTAAYKNKIFVLSGLLEGSTLGAFYLFDVDKGEWNKLPSLPVPRCAVGMVECQGQIYVVGGRTEVKSLAVVDVFDLGSEKWCKTPSMNHQRAFQSTVSCSECIFSIGGLRDRDSVVNTAERLDPRVGKWESIGRMSAKRAALGCASNSECIMAVGGVSSSEPQGTFKVLQSTEIYDPRRNAWTNGMPMTEPRAWCSLAYSNNSFYAIGGKRDLHECGRARMEQCKVGTGNRWITRDGPIRRAFHSCCVLPTNL